MSSVSASTGADRRVAPRFSALHPGKLFMPDGSALEVVIVDLSQTGARVRLRLVVATPTELVLVDRATAIAHRASVAWVKDAELGLRLTRSLSLRGAVPPPLQAAKLWCLGDAAEAPPVVHI